MANWAALQEQITGLPVAKRARHGIHFKNNDGSITANFSGKPCHYLDGAVWRAIDTKLIRLSDGWYGSPHSDVRIHPDGRVKAGGYQQYSELVGAKAGKVDGDRIVREFGFGVQYLYMKEDGFRQETVIERTPTTAEAKYLIATESGELPSKYRKSAITAVDADGDSHEFINLGQFKKWLDAAKYPVVIDPDFAGGTGDEYISGSGDYSTAHSTSDSSSTVDTSLAVGQRLYAGTYRVVRAWCIFDTSTIDDGATITQVNLKLTPVDTSDADTAFDVQIVKFVYNAIRETRYDNLLSNNADDNILANTSAMSNNTQLTSGNLSTAWVSKTGNTYYGLRSSRDVASTQPSAEERIYLASANNATEGYRPVLSVTYTAAGGYVPTINMVGNMQNLNGLRG